MQNLVGARHGRLAIGTKQTSTCALHMSAFDPKRTSQRAMHLFGSAVIVARLVHPSKICILHRPYVFRAGMQVF
jgi:hypothetical protein